MALINCPECSERISSVAEKCVHCGCALTVCPECGEAFAGSPDICSACGFDIKNARELKEGRGFKGIFDYWKANNRGDKIISRLIPIILSVLGIAFLTFAILAATSIIRLGYNKDLTKLFEIGASSTVFVIFSVVLFVLTISVSVLHFAFTPFKCGAWIRYGRINVTGFTDKMRELPKSGRSFKNMREIRAAYVSEHPRELSKAVIISSVCGVFYIVCFTVACVFLNEGINEFVVSRIIGEADGIKLVSAIDWKLLLVPMGILLLALALDVTSRALFGHKVSKWLGVPEKKADTSKPEEADKNADSTDEANDIEATDDKSTDSESVEASADNNTADGETEEDKTAESAEDTSDGSEDEAEDLTANSENAVDHGETEAAESDSEPYTVNTTDETEIIDEQKTDAEINVTESDKGQAENDNVTTDESSEPPKFF